MNFINQFCSKSNISRSSQNRITGFGEYQQLSTSPSVATPIDNSSRASQLFQTSTRVDLRIIFAFAAYIALVSGLIFILLYDHQGRIVSGKVNSIISRVDDAVQTIFHSSKVALCISGGLRTFPIPSIHESLLNSFVKNIHPREQTDIFFQIYQSPMDGCNDLFSKYPNHTVDAAIQKFRPVSVKWDSPGCDDPVIATSSCCKLQAARKRKDEQKGNGWESWKSYGRKISCLTEALNYEKAHNIQYEWFVVTRPDMYYFERPFFSVDSLSPDRVYVGSKERGEPPSDWWYIIPRKFVYKMMDSYAKSEDISCDLLKHPNWPPERTLSSYVHDKHPDMLFEVLPMLAVIVRCDGLMDCWRLDNEVTRNAKMFLVGGRRFYGVKEYCEIRQKDNIFEEFKPHLH